MNISIISTIVKVSSNKLIIYAKLLDVICWESVNISEDII